MALNSINTNIAAYYAQQNIGKASTMASSSIARLSSGNRIVRAADDVAAMSSGTSLRTNVTTLRQALVNTAQGSSLLQVADGALSQVTDILQRQKAIAAQAGSGSLSNQERIFLNQEFQALTSEIDRLVANTNFNGVKLLDGSIMVEAIDAQFMTDDVAASAYAAVFGTNNVSLATGLFQADDGTTAITNTQVVASVTSGGEANQSVIGSISNASLTWVNGLADQSEQYVNLTFEVNGVTFQALGVDIAAFDDGTAAGGSVSFVATEVTPSGDTPMTLTIVLNDLDQGQIAADGSDLDTIIGDDFEAALNATYITQQRDVTDFDTANLAGTSLAGISNATSFTTWSLDSTAAEENAGLVGEVESVVVTPVGDADDANGQITVTIAGKEYHLYNVLTATGDGNLSSADGSLTLTYRDGETSRTETINIDLTGMTGTIDLNTEEGAAALATGLEVLLGGTELESASAGLSFQVGVTTSDSLAVSMNAVDTATLFAGATLDVLTQASAGIASDALDAALNTVTAVRANVGALQSRFDFAAANVESAIQNQDAARGVLLDTDIAAEATRFATAQVQLQAGIAVLAQANQLPQNLLKLIG